MVGNYRCQNQWESGEKKNSRPIRRQVGLVLLNNLSAIRNYFQATPHMQCTLQCTFPPASALGFSLHHMKIVSPVKNRVFIMSRCRLGPWLIFYLPSLNIFFLNFILHSSVFNYHTHIQELVRGLSNPMVKISLTSACLSCTLLRHMGLKNGLLHILHKLLFGSFSLQAYIPIGRI